MATGISLALSILKAIPILDRWFQDLCAAYTARELAAMKEENRLAIIKAVSEQDQRDIEKALGSPKAGQASGIPGTEHRETLPGVKP